MLKGRPEAGGEGISDRCTQSHQSPAGGGLGSSLTAQSPAGMCPTGTRSPLGPADLAAHLDFRVCPPIGFGEVGAEACVTTENCENNSSSPPRSGKLLRGQETSSVWPVTVLEWLRAGPPGLGPGVAAEGRSDLT